MVFFCRLIVNYERRYYTYRKLCRQKINYEPLRNPSSSKILMPHAGSMIISRENFNANSGGTIRDTIYFHEK